MCLLVIHLVRKGTNCTIYPPKLSLSPEMWYFISPFFHFFCLLHPLALLSLLFMLMNLIIFSLILLLFLVLFFLHLIHLLIHQPSLQFLCLLIPLLSPLLKLEGVAKLTHYLPILMTLLHNFHLLFPAPLLHHFLLPIQKQLRLILVLRQLRVLLSKWT